MRGTRQSWGSCEWGSFPPPWSDQSHAGDRDEANTDVSEEGSLYLAVGGDKAEATQATTSPQGLGQSGDPLPPKFVHDGGPEQSIRHG